MDDSSRERRLYKDAHAQKFSHVKHFPALHAPVYGSRTSQHVLVVQEDPSHCSPPKNKSMSNQATQLHLSSPVCTQ